MHWMVEGVLAAECWSTSLTLEVVMSAIELQTKVKRCEDFTITEKAPTKYKGLLMVESTF